MAVDIVRQDSHEGYAASLPDPAALEDPDSILSALRQLESEESRIDEELSAAMLDRSVLETLLERIDSVRPVVEQVQQEAYELSRRVDETADIAERISGKVRQLDIEQSRVIESIDVVQAVQGLKTSLAALSVAIDNRDWETATRNMQRAIAVDQSITESEFADAVVPTGELPQAPAQAIHDFRLTLLNTFLREFTKASSERDEVNTSRYFKLFPAIGAEREGLEAYASFVCGIISNRPKPSLQLASNSPTFFVTLFTPLFEQIALIISQHQPVVEKYYGREQMLPVAVKLQEECDRQAGEILTQWEEERYTMRKLNEAQRHRFTQLSLLTSPPVQPQQLPQALSAGQAAAMAALKRPYQQLSKQATQPMATPVVDDETVDPREIDGLLTELAQISARWELYRRFLYSRLSSFASDATAPPHQLQPSPLLTGSPENTASIFPNAQNANVLGGDDGQVTQADLTLVEQSSFKHALHHQLATIYEPLEIWYLRSSIEKAHVLDEPDLYNKPLLSSIVDDTFFILKKVLHRQTSLASLPTVKRMCLEVRNVMERDFSDVIKKRMDAVWAFVQSSTQATRAKEEESARQSFVIYANDLDTAAEYIGRVVDEITADPSLRTAFFLTTEYNEALASLQVVKQLQDHFRIVLKTSLDQLFNQLIRPRLRVVLSECYRDVTYMLDEEAYAEVEYQDYVRKRFTKHWDALLEPYKDAMTSANYDVIFTLSIGVLSRLWESQLKSMRFTELGALRLDRDLRSITTFLSNQTTYGVSILRDSFTRLQQIAALLSIETASDADDLASGSAWKLSGQEMVNFLNLRV